MFLLLIFDLSTVYTFQYSLEYVTDMKTNICGAGHESEHQVGASLTASFLPSNKPGLFSVFLLSRGELVLLHWVNPDCNSVVCEQIGAEAFRPTHSATICTGPTLIHRATLLFSLLLLVQHCSSSLEPDGSLRQ